MPDGTVIKTALYVDFDNVYLQLQESDTQAAEAFATAPGRWLEWLAAVGPGGDRAATAPEAHLGRRFLIRRCYLNPKFWNYRADFINAGFNVIDCPNLTSKGKNSADIHMVIDMLDALAHTTRFDEFMILSGDTDFRPVLLRLRAHDRQTAVLSIANGTRAYLSCSDVIINADAFVEEALVTASAPAGDDDNEALLETIAERLAARVGAGPVPARDFVEMLKQFPAFTKDSDWLGFGSLRRVADEVVSRATGLEIVAAGGSWIIQRHGTVAPAAPALLVPAPPPVATLDIRPLTTEAPAIARKPAVDLPAAKADLAQSIINEIRACLAESARPVVSASVAQRMHKKFGPIVLESEWAGAGSLKTLVAKHPSHDIALTEGSPGFFYNPARHEPPDASAQALLPAGLPPFAERLHTILGVPRLAPNQFATVYAELAAAVNADEFHMTTTSKRVRDATAEHGVTVGRSDINFIINGIRFMGVRIESPVTADDLGRAFSHNIQRLCENRQLGLSVDDMRDLTAWLTGAPVRDVAGGVSAAGPAN